MTLKEKGWKVNVLWKDQFLGGKCIGIGLFAQQDIPEGSILRIGKFGHDILIYNRETNIPDITNPGTLEHLANYSIVCPCQMVKGGDDMVLWLPGVGINHSTNPNCMVLCTVNGMCIISIQDIKDGEALVLDYNSFGSVPTWYEIMLRNNLGTATCVFPGANDYVNEC